MHASADDVFEDCEFPATRADLTATLGDREVEVVDGTERVAEAVERGGGEVFETAEDAKLALYSGLGGDAVGRRRYSDRDPATPGADEPLARSF